MPTAPYSQLILAPPAESVEGQSIAAALLEAAPTFQTYLGKWMDNAGVPFQHAIHSGLPYLVPFSFETSMAERFAEELREKSWRVVVIASAWMEPKDL